MKKDWDEVIVRRIYGVAYMKPSTDGVRHRNRPYHIIVLNGASGSKDYHFDDGRVMHTKPGSLFYLPRGSSYTVKVNEPGECYAVCFDADITDEPFVLAPRNQERLLHHFRSAERAWKYGEPDRISLGMRVLYDCIYHMQKENERAYAPSGRYAMIAPALEVLKTDFTSNELSVASLAELCGISVVYFRRLFMTLYDISPKEFIIQKRIEYAKTLLSTGDFSVSEVSELCGYVAPSHFSREFQMRVGVAPSEYGESIG